MVLPFTVVTSFYFLHSRPSSLILLACLFVTAGFFVGVFMDGTSISAIGVFFGVTSSVITALHSVVIKKSLDVVQGSALNLSFFTNLLSACVLAPIVVLAGETPSVFSLFFDDAAGVNGGMSPLSTFLWGSFITVSASISLV
jgi:GDP-fucose transporter C1